MGMKVSIYRHALAQSETGDVSQRCDSLCIVNVPGPFSPTDDSPAAILVRQETGDIVVVPQDIINSRKWFTSSGNYAYTSDHRFTDTVEAMSGHSYAFPVAIYDRVE